MTPRVLLTWHFCPSAPSLAATNIFSAWTCIRFQISSSSSRTKGFPWAPTATCISLMPWRTTAARITTATPPSPNYAPSSRRSPWPSQSGAVGLQNTMHSSNENRARRDTEPMRLLSNTQLIPDEIKAWLFFKRICLSIEYIYIYLLLCIPAGLYSDMQRSHSCLEICWKQDYPVEGHKLKRVVVFSAVFFAGAITPPLSDIVTIVLLPVPEVPPMRMPSMLLPPGVQTEKVVLKGELLQLECIAEG